MWSLIILEKECKYFVLYTVEAGKSRNEIDHHESPFFETVIQVSFSFKNKTDLIYDTKREQFTSSDDIIASWIFVSKTHTRETKDKKIRRLKKRGNKSLASFVPLTMNFFPDNTKCVQQKHAVLSCQWIQYYSCTNWIQKPERISIYTMDRCLFFGTITMN